MQTLTRRDMVVIEDYNENNEWKCAVDETNTYIVKQKKIL